MKTSNSVKGITRLGAALAAAVVVASSSSPAAAASSHTSATVTLITQNGTNAGFGSPGIFINATNAAGQGLTFVASSTVGGTCSAHAQNVDTMKSFLSVAQSALLSGKKVNIYYNPCGGFNYIIGIDLLL